MLIIELHEVNGTPDVSLQRTYWTSYITKQMHSIILRMREGERGGREGERQEHSVCATGS